MSRRLRFRQIALWIVVPVQLACAGFFIWDIGAGLLGLRSEPLSWQMHEMIEIGAATGLILGVMIGAAFLVSTMRRNATVEAQLRAASGAFAELLEERFAQWSLTPAETEVAWLTLKGFSNGEIAAMLGKSEGTVKAQSYAIFRKADVAGRTQLLSLFIEDLLGVERGGRIGAAEVEERVVAAK